MGSDTPGHLDDGRPSRRIARLIEVSNEMSLNAMDGQFVRGEGGRPPGKIYYVFDESAFEAFIRPDERRRKYAAYFHVRDWRNSGADDPESYWILVNEMITIVAAEYMFGGALPGQRDGDLFMTYWHRKELEASVHKIVSDYGEIVSTRPVSHQKRLREALYQLRQIDSEDDLIDNDRLDIKILSDVDNFLRLSDSKIGANQLQRARKLAKIFANYKFEFIDHQIDRIANTFETRLKTLNAQFELDDREGADVAAQSRYWRDRLTAAYAARDDDERRSAVGFTRDALSVSLVQHIARHRLASDERIVLVTGDRLLLETYWSWYSDRYVENPWEPNVLRSVAHFSPIMNFNDMDRDPDRARTPAPALFDLLQLALDLALAPYNLSARPPDSSDEPPRHVPNLYGLRRRILTNAIDHRIFPPEQTEAGLQAASETFLGVRDRCQEIERNAIWRGLESLERRASEAVRRANASTDDGGNPDDALEYFRRRMRELALAAARISLPVVTLFVERDSKLARPSFRAPLALRLNLPTSSKGYEQIDIVTALDERKVNVPALKDQPHLIFVIGSLLAIQLSQWSDAERYAEFAKVASKYFRGSGADRQSAEYQELRYLRAVCTRLMMGSMSPKPRGEADGIGEFRDVWLEKLRIAEQNLNNCEDFHKQAGQWVREIRVISERASLRLFYAAWARVVPDGFYSGDNARTMLHKGVVDLAAAFDTLSAHAGAHVGPDEVRIHQRVTRQIIVNIAAVDVLWGDLDGPMPHKAEFEPLLERALPTIGPWIASQTDVALPEALFLEIACFAERHGLPGPRPGPPSPRRPRLALDRALIDFLAPRLPAPRSHAESR